MSDPYLKCELSPYPYHPSPPPANLGRNNYLLSGQDQKMKVADASTLSTVVVRISKLRNGR
jgi:hypothetical protein